MKRKLLRSFAVLAMVLMCGNAWADRDTSKPVYVPELDVENGTASFDDIYSAMEGVKKYFDSNSGTTTYNIELWDNANIYSGSEKNTGRVTLDKAITVNIKPEKDGITITRRSCPRTSMWFLAKVNSANMNIGCDSYPLTIAADGHADNQRIFNAVCKAEANSTMTINNVTFKNFRFDKEKESDTYEGYLFLGNNSQYKLILKNITIDNCIATRDAMLKSLYTNSDAINIYGYLNFTNCEGTCFDIKGRMKMGDGNNVYSGFSATTPITIRFSGTAPTKNSQLIVAKGKNYLDKFILLNENLGLYADNNDLRCNQAYTATTLTDANGAATLVLPFESTIPEGVKAYKLTSVSNNIIATEEVTGKLSADNPVLINTKHEGGQFKFVSTNTTKDANFATGSGTPTSGLLTGVYSDTQVAAGNYILAKETSGVGFYKSNGSSKVTANHAYLTIPSSSSSAARFFSIGIGDDGTTMIKGVEMEGNDMGKGIYNINGMRMQKPTKAGMYIINGKKVIIK